MGCGTVSTRIRRNYAAPGAGFGSGDHSIAEGARRAALQSAGITHILIDWSEIARYRSPGNYGFPDYVTPARVRGELIDPHGPLRPVPTPDLPEHVELFAVVADEPREGAPISEPSQR